MIFFVWIFSCLPFTYVFLYVMAMHEIFSQKQQIRTFKNLVSKLHVRNLWKCFHIHIYIIDHQLPVNWIIIGGIPPVISFEQWSLICLTTDRAYFHVFIQLWPSIIWLHEYKFTDFFPCVFPSPTFQTFSSGCA